MLGMFHFRATYLGYRRARSPSRYATCSHIFFMGFCNQIKKENFPETFLFHFTTTCCMEQKGIEDGHTCQVAKQFVTPLPRSPGNSATIHHPVRFVHISHVSVIVLYFTRFDCMARIVAEIAFHWRSVHICENIDVAFILPNFNTLISSDPRDNVSLFCFYCPGLNVFGHYSPVIANISATIYFPSEQIIK